VSSVQLIVCGTADTLRQAWGCHWDVLLTQIIECKKAPTGCEKYELSGKVRRDEDNSAAVDQAASATVEEASSETATQVDPGTINYNQDAPEDFVQTADVNGDDNTCATQGCSEALPYCLKACGFGPHCEGYCACMLHSNPKSICRQQGT